MAKTKIRTPDRHQALEPVLLVPSTQSTDGAVSNDDLHFTSDSGVTANTAGDLGLGCQHRCDPRFSSISQRGAEEGVEAGTRESKGGPI